MLNGMCRVVRVAHWKAALLLGLTLQCACERSVVAGADATDGREGAVDAADSGQDAAAVDGFRSDAADSDPADVHSCTGDLECDDGNPRTVDTCYTLQGICIHRIAECLVDIDCDDHDPYTDDACHRDPGSLDAVCRHSLLPGRCITAADCADGFACSTETCVDRICRYDVPESCVVQCTSYPPCGSLDAIGMPCGSLPVARSDCLAMSGTCPELHLCGDTFYAGHAAGVACPSASCPATPPTAGTACGSSPLRCDYGTRPGETCSTGDFGPTTSSGSAFSGTHPEGRPRCDCIAGSWRCQVEVCPLTPPTDGAPALRPPADAAGRGDCTYRNQRCSIQADPPTYNTFHWRCVFPRPCPLVAVDGASCDHVQDDHCSYQRQNGAQPSTQYSGDCVCGIDAHWHCDANRAADCPSAVPLMVLGCTATSGTQDCVYFDGVTSTVTYRCNCSGLWNCARQ